MISGPSLFEYSDKILVFCYFFVFYLASMSYSIFVSIFFSKARTASIVGSLIFFAGWFLYIGLTAEGAEPTRSQIIAASLHPAAAFAFATMSFVEYEDAQIGVTAFTWNTSEQFEVTFQEMVIMLFIDFLYLGFLSWYFSQIWPSEFGTHKPWYFLFERKFWVSDEFGDKRRVSDEALNSGAVVVVSISSYYTSCDHFIRFVLLTCICPLPLTDSKTWWKK